MRWQNNCMQIVFVTFNFTIMQLGNEELPATLQAFDLSNDQEIFLAEQLVSNQTEIENFTSRYAGKLIKAKKNAISRNASYTTAGYKSRFSAFNLLMILFVLAIAVLVLYGLSTGWIQQRIQLK
jgi:hypothetical protein